MLAIVAAAVVGTTVLTIAASMFPQDRRDGIPLSAALALILVRTYGGLAALLSLILVPAALSWYAIYAVPLFLATATFAALSFVTAGRIRRGGGAGLLVVPIIIGAAVAAVASARLSSSAQLLICLAALVHILWAFVVGALGYAGSTGSKGPLSTSSA